MEEVKDKIQVQDDCRDHVLNHCTALLSQAHFPYFWSRHKTGRRQLGPCLLKAYSGFLGCSSRLPMILAIELFGGIQCLGHPSSLTLQSPHPLYGGFTP